ncbi:MAG TPA: hypothetical protein VFL15_07530 [Gammaproteobacteria bacterium]|nr:hypothetical protein [Gammaproteobacteria bacterium]
MSNRRLSRLTAGIGFSIALLLSAGCSSSKPYTLAAQLAPSAQSGLVAATIDVNGGGCAVRVMMANNPQAWTPVCIVNKDQSGFKSFTIGGTQVDFGAVPGGFKVLSATLPTLPAPAAATAAAPAVAATGKGGATTAPPPAAANAVAAVTPVFPDQWSMTPYAGTVTLQGQNLGFLITSATLKIHGSQGILDVTFKASYSPLHMVCTVISNAHGDFNLIFDPTQTSKLTGGGNYSVQLVSEGAGITGNVWDSHGFDSWTPGLPPQWVATSVSSN